MPKAGVAAVFCSTTRIRKSDTQNPDLPLVSIVDTVRFMADRDHTTVLSRNVLARADSAQDLPVVVKT
jgi:hypothetical protein